MEENKVEEKKVEKKNNSSLPIVVFIFVMLILIGAIVYLCITFENSRKEDQKTIDGLKASIKSEQETNLKLKTTIDDLQGKIDDIDDTLNSTTQPTEKTTEDKTEPEENKVSETNNNTTSDKKISAEEAKEKVEKYLVIYTDHGDALLEELELNGKVDKNSKHDFFYDEEHPEIGYATNVKFDEFKAKALEYVTREFFDDRFGKVNEYNGYLYLNGQPALYKFVISDLELKSENNGEYVFSGSRIEKRDRHDDMTKSYFDVTFKNEDGVFKVVKIDITSREDYNGENPF